MVRRPTLMAVQGAALIVGTGYLLLGALGFLPGVTTNYERLQWIGHQSDALLFGVFATSGLHNVLHLLLGAAGMFCARTYAASRAYLSRSSACGSTAPAPATAVSPRSSPSTAPTTGCISRSAS